MTEWSIAVSDCSCVAAYIGKTQSRGEREHPFPEHTLRSILTAAFLPRTEVFSGIKMHAQLRVRVHERALAALDGKRKFLERHKCAMRFQLCLTRSQGVSLTLRRDFAVDLYARRCTHKLRRFILEVQEAKICLPRFVYFSLLKN